MVLAAAAFIVSCNSYGERHEVNKNSFVYYKGEGVNAEDAKRLGDFLLKNGYFDTVNQKTVQLTSSNDTMNVKFAVDKTKVSDDNAEMLFSIMGAAISTDAFAGKPVKVVLADEKMEPFKELPINTSVTDISTEDSTISISPEDSVRRQ